MKTNIFTNAQRRVQLSSISPFDTQLTRHAEFRGTNSQGERIYLLDYDEGYVTFSTISISPNLVTLYGLFAQPYSVGLGTRAMKLVSKIADRTNTTIGLSAYPGRDDMSLAQLMKFYAKFGFVKNGLDENGYNRMTRVPK